MTFTKRLLSLLAAFSFVLFACGDDPDTSDRSAEEGVDASVAVSQSHSGAGTVVLNAADLQKQTEWLSQNCFAAADVRVRERSYELGVWNDEGQKIPWTHWRLDVGSVIFNKNDIELADVYFPGGKIDDQEMYFANSPNDITAGDSLILFYGTYRDKVSPCSGAIGVLKIVDGVVEGTKLTVEKVKNIIQKN